MARKRASERSVGRRRAISLRARRVEVRLPVVNLDVRRPEIPANAGIETQAAAEFYVVLKIGGRDDIAASEAAGENVASWSSPAGPAGNPRTHFPGRAAPAAFTVV